MKVVSIIYSSRLKIPEAGHGKPDSATAKATAHTGCGISVRKQKDQK